MQRCAAFAAVSGVPVWFAERQLVAAEAVRVLGAINDQPFFLAVGFWKPHAPFNAPKRYWDLYDRARLPALDPRRPAGAPEIAFHDSREVLGLPGPGRIAPTPEPERTTQYYGGRSVLQPRRPGSTPTMR